VFTITTKHFEVFLKPRKYSAKPLKFFVFVSVRVGNCLSVLPGFPQMWPKNFYATKLPSKHFLQQLVTHQLSQTTIKHDVTKKSLLILSAVLLLCFLWHNKHWSVHLLTKHYNFMNFVKNCRNFCARTFWDIARIFNKSKPSGGVHSHPWTTVRDHSPSAQRKHEQICAHVGKTYRVHHCFLSLKHLITQGEKYI